MTPADPVAIAVIVAAILDQLGIRYIIGRFSRLVADGRTAIDTRSRFDDRLRQWRDVLGIIKMNPDLDRRLLREAAREAEVDDVLNRALEPYRGT